MLRILLPEDADRAALIHRLEDRMGAIPVEIERSVRHVIDEVRARGDEAVRAFTLQWEKRELGDLELSRTDWEREAQKTAPDVRAAIERARDRIARFHERQRQEGYVLTEPGIELELKISPLRQVALYVPGGTARYP